MSPTHTQTKHLNLIPQTREEVRAYVEQMQPQERAAVSAAWLVLLDGSSPADPWIHGCALVGCARNRFGRPALRAATDRRHHIVVFGAGGNGIRKRSGRGDDRQQDIGASLAGG
jgi:hypothetical protein